jgi:antitoxin HigA-1
MSMKKTLHPGRIIRQDCLESLGLSVTKAAEVLGVSRQTINNLVNEKAGISPEMAIRLSKAFGDAPETWLQLQMRYDLAEAQRRKSKIKVKRYEVGESVDRARRVPQFSKRA